MEPAGKKINKPTKDNEKRYIKIALIINKLLFSKLINFKSLIDSKLIMICASKLILKELKSNFFRQVVKLINLAVILVLMANCKIGGSDYHSPEII